MTKQEMYNQFVTELALINIVLKKHSFAVLSGFKPNTQNQVTIKHNVIRIKQQEMQIAVDLNFDVVCKRGETPVWKAAYSYLVIVRLQKQETIDSVLEDEELRKVFENRQMIQFLWPYFRQELQSDTLKAGIPVFVIPPRN